MLEFNTTHGMDCNEEGLSPTIKLLIELIGDARGAATFAVVRDPDLC